MNELAEAQLYKYRKVLDHGYVALVDYMGTDSSITQAARVSYGKGTKTVSDDETLIRYLLNHKHTTPFEMVQLKFNIAMPIHCHRQFIRHRMSTTNEYSARYSEVPEVTYADYNLNKQSKSNKQGRSDELIEDNFYAGQIQTLTDEAFGLYHDLINDGVAKEIARMHLPLNTYTYFYWKIDLHNLFHFLRLRCDGHAQYEIRQFANCLAALVKDCYPIAFRAWYDYVYGAVSFSRQDRVLLNNRTKYIITNGLHNIENVNERLTEDGIKLGMSKREINDFFKKLELPEEQDFSLDNFELIEKDTA